MSYDCDREGFSWVAVIAAIIPAMYLLFLGFGLLGFSSSYELLFDSMSAVESSDALNKKEIEKQKVVLLDKKSINAEVDIQVVANDTERCVFWLKQSVIYPTKTNIFQKDKACFFD